MRHFVYFSGTARTSGNFRVDKLMEAGRMDIVMHVIIHAFFLSNKLRENVKVHLVFYGSPSPPRHIELQIKPETNLSKKDIGNLIKKILYKYKKGEKKEILPGCWIEKKDFSKVVETLSSEGNEIFILDKKGENLRGVKIPKDCVFVLGDQDGLPKKEVKRLKNLVKRVSVGKEIYFASQVVTIINNELDLRGL